MALVLPLLTHSPKTFLVLSLPMCYLGCWATKEWENERTHFSPFGCMRIQKNFPRGVSMGVRPHTGFSKKDPIKSREFYDKFFATDRNVLSPSIFWGSRFFSRRLWRAWRGLRAINLGPQKIEGHSITSVGCPPTHCTETVEKVASRLSDLESWLSSHNLK